MLQCSLRTANPKSHRAIVDYTSAVCAALASLPNAITGATTARHSLMAIAPSGRESTTVTQTHTSVIPVPLEIWRWNSYSSDSVYLPRTVWATNHPALSGYLSSWFHNMEQRTALTPARSVDRVFPFVDQTISLHLGGTTVFGTGGMQYGPGTLMSSRVFDGTQGERSHAMTIGESLEDLMQTLHHNCGLAPCVRDVFPVPPPALEQPIVGQETRESLPQQGEEPSSLASGDPCRSKEVMPIQCTECCKITLPSESTLNPQAAEFVPRLALNTQTTQQ